MAEVFDLPKLSYLSADVKVDADKIQQCHIVCILFLYEKYEIFNCKR